MFENVVSFDIEKISFEVAIRNFYGIIDVLQNN